jgi:hypothetical protein
MPGLDNVPHSDLLKSVVRRVVDRHVLWVIKLWLKARSRNGMAREGDD